MNTVHMVQTKKPNVLAISGGRRGNLEQHRLLPGQDGRQHACL
jgi:hypothetical protein